MVNALIKIIEFFTDIVWPGKLKELQIRVKRINTNDPTEIEEFKEIYEEAFPYDGKNYTSNDMLSVLDDINNSKKHIKADNIVLIAKYKGNLIGFIACFYYPEIKYGIIGYFGKTKRFNSESKHASKKLLKKLKAILMKGNGCNLLVFELEHERRENEKDRLFRLFAKSVGLQVYELRFNYLRPKIHLNDLNEESLRLLIVPIKEVFEERIGKRKVIEILEFIHFNCYGDYYDKLDKDFSKYQQYMKSRIKFYKQNLPKTIELN